MKRERTSLIEQKRLYNWSVKLLHFGSTWSVEGSVEQEANYYIILYIILYIIKGGICTQHACRVIQFSVKTNGVFLIRCYNFNQRGPFETKHFTQNDICVVGCFILFYFSHLPCVKSQFSIYPLPYPSKDYKTRCKLKF